MLPIKLIGISGPSRTYKVTPGWLFSSLNPPLKWHFEENDLIAVCHLLTTYSKYRHTLVSASNHHSDRVLQRARRPYLCYYIAVKNLPRRKSRPAISAVQKKETGRAQEQKQADLHKQSSSPFLHVPVHWGRGSDFIPKPFQRHTQRRAYWIHPGAALCRCQYLALCVFLSDAFCTSHTPSLLLLLAMHAGIRLLWAGHLRQHNPLVKHGKGPRFRECAMPYPRPPTTEKTFFLAFRRAVEDMGRSNPARSWNTLSSRVEQNTPTLECCITVSIAGSQSTAWLS